MNICVKVKCRLDSEYEDINEAVLRARCYDIEEQGKLLRDLHNLLDTTVQAAFEKGREYQESLTTK